MTLFKRIIVHDDLKIKSIRSLCGFKFCWVAPKSMKNDENFLFVCCFFYFERDRDRKSENGNHTACTLYMNIHMNINPSRAAWFMVCAPLKWCSANEGLRIHIFISVWKTMDKCWLWNKRSRTMLSQIAKFGEKCSYDCSAGADTAIQLSAIFDAKHLNIPATKWMFYESL